MYLNKEDYLPFAPEESDTQININHNNCDAGEDTKRRLYIRRLDDGGTILAHCHHCGKSGYHRESATRSVAAIRRHISYTDGSTTSISLPTDYEVNQREWPARARAWVYKYGITDEEITRAGIGYSAKARRVVLPSWSEGNLLGFQERKIFDDDPLPKYITRYNEKNFVWKDLTGGDTLVICEDILSAIKLRRFYSSMALLSTHLHKNAIKYCFDMKRILVFLDNNNNTVRLQSLKIKNELELYVPSVDIITIERDPKTLSNKELEHLVCMT
jgi:hypothetical protein